MAIQVVSDYFFQLVPNTLTFFFTIVFITLFALGSVFVRRYKVYQLERNVFYAIISQPGHYIF